jgi:hypothetical protein
MLDSARLVSISDAATGRADHISSAECAECEKLMRWPGTYLDLTSGITGSDTSCTDKVPVSISRLMKRRGKGRENKENLNIEKNYAQRVKMRNPRKEVLKTRVSDSRSEM